MTPEQRRLKASAAAHAQWSKETDRTQRTAKAREGQMARYRRQVDPEGRLDPEQREKMARSALRAHMTSMALRSSIARSRRARAKRRGEAGD
jgi:hypothetical protein